MLFYYLITIQFESPPEREKERKKERRKEGKKNPTAVVFSRIN